MQLAPPPHRDADSGLIDASIDLDASETNDADAAETSTDAALEVSVTEPPKITLEEAEIVLFPRDADRAKAHDECRREADDSAKIRCLLRRLYASDTRAATLAEEIFVRSGTIVGVEEEGDMDGGYRGTLHLVPEPAVGTYRKHLEWIDGAVRDEEAFFTALIAKSQSKVSYRWKPLAYRVFRSVNRHTPAAYAHHWTIAYNVSGSLNTSADAVRETMFHELFHLNDAAHDDWSHRKLAATHAAIVARCGTKIACLQPYAPNDTTVRGGTYYAFQPGNEEHEYAAELAIRYYREHRERLGVGPGRAPPKPFKCGPEENARSWALIRDEFFGGVDLTPACR